MLGAIGLLVSVAKDLPFPRAAWIPCALALLVASVAALYRLKLRARARLTSTPLFHAALARVPELGGLVQSEGWVVYAEPAGSMALLEGAELAGARGRPLS